MATCAFTTQSSAVPWHTNPRPKQRRPPAKFRFPQLASFRRIFSGRWGGRPPRLNEPVRALSSAESPSIRPGCCRGWVRSAQLRTSTQNSFRHPIPFRKMRSLRPYRKFVWLRSAFPLRAFPPRTFSLRKNSSWGGADALVSRANPWSHSVSQNLLLFARVAAACGFEAHNPLVRRTLSPIPFRKMRHFFARSSNSFANPADWLRSANHPQLWITLIS
jgi:hypothetical protein